MDIPRISSPTWAVSSPRPSRTPGMRATQVARLRPLRMKMTNTALRQAESSRRLRVVGVGVVCDMMFLMVRMWPDVLLGTPSNRFDRIDSTKLSEKATDFNRRGRKYP